MTFQLKLLKSLLVCSPMLALPLQANQGEYCQGFGPQAPRDIDQLAGENQRVFSLAPPSTQMNLCNIHFHAQAEHKAAAFSKLIGEGEHAGYQCDIATNLTAAELAPPKVNHCKGLKPGDTVEVHWVHSSCNAKPGPGLGACLTEQCANPNLRVETQVFTLVNDAGALNFNDFDYDGHQANGYHQPKALPTDTGTPVEYLGSTTGPKYNQQQCSSLQVSWSVRPQCAKLDINSLSQWCANNEFAEDHAHGVRKLVVHPKLLSPIN
ncbi:hypothetical protein GCM10009092_00490 [Bowmanella denitrificans]|uniref:Cadmium carbonic anhydrase n=1 Tax=Bowmanella denitrificans TaxID=366582 RepID=A0ABP3GBC5_9ALTE